MNYKKENERKLKQLNRHRNIKGWVGGIFLIAVCFLTLFAPVIAPYDPYEQELASIFVKPFTHSAVSDKFFLLGTDQLGRDILSRILYGGRVSLALSLAAVLVSLIIGTILGIMAGYYRGKTDVVIMRLADIQLSIPTMLFAILIIAVMGASLTNTIIVLAITGWVPFTRVVRSEVLALREQEFIESAKAMGVSNFRIILTHILPNITYTLITQATLRIAQMIMLAASLSFMGLGVNISMPTWGGMISDGRNYIYDAWWLSTFPGITIALVIFMIAIFSEWMQARTEK